jgi:hypothetical protein
VIQDSNAEQQQRVASNQEVVRIITERELLLSRLKDDPLIVPGVIDCGELQMMQLTIPETLWKAYQRRTALTSKKATAFLKDLGPTFDV